jgi:uncharacterized membrane protein YgdD (TMEM256/DUF423 family)
VTSRQDFALLLWAACLGLGGVAAAAAAAHGAAGSPLGSASLILLTHAPAIIACLIASRVSLISARMGRITALGLAFGATLFSIDMASRTGTGLPLFPLAAPLGGLIIMIGWGVMATAAALGFFTRPSPRDKGDHLR